MTAHTLVLAAIIAAVLLAAAIAALTLILCAIAGQSNDELRARRQAEHDDQAIALTQDEPGEPRCPLCGDTGWLTWLTLDGYGYETPCPAQCPMPELPPTGGPR